MSDEDDRKQCCIDAEPHNCGDCYGGTEYDPYVNGALPREWKNDDYYDGGRLIHRRLY